MRRKMSQRISVHIICIVAVVWLIARLPPLFRIAQVADYERRAERADNRNFTYGHIH